VHTYPITKEAKHSEITTIKSILHNNEYDTNLMKRPTQKINQETDTDTKRKTIWATFTYSGKQIRKITKVFKNTKIKTAFRTQNTIQNILQAKTQTDKYTKFTQDPNIKSTHKNKQTC
jgi:hypothetical protein